MDDLEGKTEQPTPKRLSDLKKLGVVARSLDLTISIQLLICIGILFFFAHFIFDRLIYLIRSLFISLNTPIDNPQVVIFFLQKGINQLLMMLSPLLAGIVVVGILANVAQVGILFSWAPLKPRWSRLNIFKGSNYERNFSWPALIRLSLGLLRLNSLVVISWLMITSDMFVVYSLMDGTAWQVLNYITHKVLMLGAAFSICYLGFGVIDYIYQQIRYLKLSRMRRQEVKDEQKLLEGDVKVKAKVRSFMKKIAGQFDLQAMSAANIVITEGVHYAVALSYSDREGVPICVCKGANYRADQMRQQANKLGIVLFEDPRLAFDLYHAVEVRNPIPRQFYHKVAAALAYADLLRKSYHRKNLTIQTSPKA